ncbi:MAG: hypothetical protein A2V90_07275 [Gammaproteobacteria bacterium RBG_16_57_12]|nr:MAG: hypothetical protein A2V90_07275 [Gammaproteobacteria bacterium RBG_16_57_12]
MNLTADIIARLLDENCYPHHVENIRLLETHISWVILSGPYAYKVKKPLDLGFLDFSTLEKRHYYCLEELRLNRRLAPQLYVDVVSINGSPDAPRFEGLGEILDYAVRMRQFPQSAMLAEVLARNELTAGQLDRLVDDIARFHHDIIRSTADQPYGDPEHIFSPVMENFTQIRHWLSEHPDQAALDELQSWTQRTFDRLRPVFDARKQQGFIRECHGDMHLGNMVLLDGRITLFDGIEFNPDLYRIDVMNDIAFLVMDLQHRGQSDGANRVLNRYLEITGDYAGLVVLRFYRVYRAMVRAKVACIRAGQASLPTAQRQATVDEYHGYLQQALDYIRRDRPALLINHGLSGSGKTRISQRLLEHLGAIRLRSDIERKRMFNIPAHQSSQSGIQSGIYTAEATSRTYQHLHTLSRDLLENGHIVIVDATFLDRTHRASFRDLANSLGIPYLILHYEAREEILRERIRQRMQAADDASEADLRILESQLARYEPLSDPERRQCISINTEDPVDIQALIKQIRLRLDHCAAAELS